jgi:pyruvate/2-oxoglutarate dehydrogenase complex dihydrolipoamide acyltransferase (E2) component
MDPHRPHAGTVRRRSDGTYLDVPALRRVVPYLLRTRTTSTVYFPQRIEVDDLLPWLEDVNRDRPRAERITLFHVFLTAIARTVRLRPEVNRFIAGRRTYEHNEISISFIVKESLADDGNESEVRLVLTGEETVEEIRRLVETSVGRERSGAQNADDRLVRFFMSWPRPFLELVSKAIAALDYLGLMPASLVKAIPLYTSVYVVNTGSIGIDPPFHHLYDYGTASAFVAIGRVTREPVVDEDGAIVARSGVNVVYSLDERATDGYYFARTAEVIRRLVAEPALLAAPGATVETIVPTWPPRR